MKETSANRNSNQARWDREECNVETDIYRRDSMMETFQNRHSNHTRRNNPQECYNVSSTGATIACDSSVDAISKDSAKLPGDK